MDMRRCQLGLGCRTGAEVLEYLLERLFGRYSAEEWHDERGSNGYQRL